MLIDLVPLCSFNGWSFGLLLNSRLLINLVLLLGFSFLDLLGFSYLLLRFKTIYFLIGLLLLFLLIILFFL